MTKTFSNKSNASRAARQQGLDPATAVQQDAAGAWYVSAAPEAAPQPSQAAPVEIKAVPEALAKIFAHLQIGYVAADSENDRYNAMIDALTEAFELGTAQTAPAKATRKPRESSKRQQVVTLLLRPEGTTLSEIKDVTGWQAISIPAVAKSAGLTLRKERPEGESAARYYGTQAA